jgi:hypothetical protein
MTSSLQEKDGLLWWDRIAFIPSIHGRAAFAREARRVFLSGRYPTVAVELPESLAEKTLEGIESLPLLSVVTYEETNGTRCFFPIDPCDSIIEALRLGLGENCALEFIDCDVEEFERTEVVLPDSYAVNSIGLPRFYEAVKAALPQVAPGSQDDRREEHMAARLRRLLKEPSKRLPILCVLGLSHLEGIVRHLGKKAPLAAAPPAPPPIPSLRFLSEDSLYHILGELPYTTHQFEEQRQAISLDEFEAVDKLKDLLLEARERYHKKRTEEFEQISLASFQNLLQLLRNSCLLQKKLTPSLYEMAFAAKGIVGSEFAIEVIETAKRYPPLQRGTSASEKETDGAQGGFFEGETEETGFDTVEMTESAMIFDGAFQPAKKRYVDVEKVWKKLKLEPPPPLKEKKKWRTAWNPNVTCSWTPEDVLIENFAGHVRKRALLESGIAQEHLEEFRTSFKDGIHIRETIRNLHLGKIIVKETPPVRGQVGAVVIIYERPDPKKFPWKLTWFPEYEWESILAFYATDYHEDLVGPGIARSTYGGQIFLRTLGPVPDIWSNPLLDEARDDAERLLFGAVRFSPEHFVAFLSASAPSSRMKEYARLHGKKIIYLPLSSFSRSTLQRLRRFHVLNGKPVRSYARQFIR